MSDVAELTGESFDSVVGGAGVWLVDFWADWCAPCHALEPVLHELAAESSEVSVGKLDVTAYPKIGERYGVRSLPTVIVFRDGAEVRRLFGTKTKRQLLAAAKSTNPA